MNSRSTDSPTSSRATRRDVLRYGALAATAAAFPTLSSSAARADNAAGSAKRPNVLLILCDQLGWDAMSWMGCRDVSTPNLDRLRDRSVAFTQAHTPSSVCSPARGALFTGRAPAETGVILNNRELRPGLVNMGQAVSAAGYDAVYCGKWHLKENWAVEGSIPGFRVLPTGDGQGALVDHTITLSCEAFLQSRAERDKPFLMVASYMQPHDICFWAIHNEQLVPTALPFERLREHLPELPPNHHSRPTAPADLDRLRYRKFENDDQWRYYLYAYYRMVEMLDAEVGQLLDALDRSGEADNTIVLFTSDHGDGRGRHGHVQKWYPYDEAARVPLMVSWPQRFAPRTDEKRLVDLLDVVPTVCDYAGVTPPEKLRGQTLRPLLESSTAATAPWRSHLVADFRQAGRFVRSDRYKFVHFRGDPVEQLFDLKNDPWETRNVYQEASLRDVIDEHRNVMLAREASLEYAPNVDPVTWQDKEEPLNVKRKRKAAAAAAAD